MINLNNIINKDPYSFKSTKKKKNFLNEQKIITSHHNKNCSKYKKIIDGKEISKISSIKDLPYLSVNLFKQVDLCSVKKSERFKTLTSSGTSGEKSKIILDKKTASLQQEALLKISKNFLGNDRLPMIIVDNEKILSNKKLFSARGAAILGFSIFGKEKCFILNEKLELDKKKLDLFIKKYQNSKFLIFGFTYQIWKYLINNKKKINIKNKSIILHGGGWKKMQDISVNNSIFKKRLKEIINIESVINYYGMVEQVGSIFMECNHGYFHCSNLSDIIIRNENFDVVPNGSSGIIQMLSILPWSYPGQSILTEDIGIIHGEDDCKCGRYGKYFSIMGRIPKSEIRGCSDTGIS
jgi:hypothetical protein